MAICGVVNFFQKRQLIKNDTVPVPTDGPDVRAMLRHSEKRSLVKRVEKLQGTAKKNFKNF